MPSQTPAPSTNDMLSGIVRERCCLLHAHELGVRAEPVGVHAEHAVADRELVTSGADRHDHAGHLGAEDRQLRSAQAAEEADDDRGADAKPGVGAVQPPRRAPRRGPRRARAPAVGTSAIERTSGRPVLGRGRLRGSVHSAFLSSTRAPDRARLASMPCRPRRARRACRRRRRTVPGGRSGITHPVVGGDASTEVRAVELHAPHRLVHGAQLGERERGADECRREARHLEIGAHSAIASLTIRRWSNASVDLPSSTSDTATSDGGGGVGAGGDRPTSRSTARYAHRHHVHARIALRIAVRAELGQQARGIDAGLLAQLSLGGLVQRLGGQLEAARDRPHALERRLPTAARAAPAAAPSTIVRITTSTVTANAGNFDGS